MGAKYQPTIKDRQANQRFQRQQKLRLEIKKNIGGLAPKKPGKP